MLKLASSVLLVGACAFVQSAFGFAKYVDITTTYEGNDVANFPVLVKITSTTPAGFYNDVKNAGADLKFTDATGNGDYPYEIDTWNASGDSYIWVKLPTLSAKMTFRMYYGDEEQTKQTTNPTDVWTGYERVLHVGEAKDSAKGAAMAFCEGGRPTDGPVGKGYGQETSGGKASIECELAEYKRTQFTVSVWMKMNVDLPGWVAILGPRNTATAACWGLSSTTKSLRVNVAGKDAGLCNDFKTEGLVSSDKWSKLDVVYNDLTTSLYCNGVLVEQPFTTTKPAQRIDWGAGKTVTWMYFGGTGDAQTLNGSGLSSNGIGADFDECRILNESADPVRIAADYQTVANVAEFLKFGAPQGGPVVLPQGVIVK